MFNGRTAARIIVTPQDEHADPGLVQRTLEYCFAHSRGPCVFSHFGAQWEPLWDGFALLLGRSQPLLGVLDHVQFSGPSEQKVTHPFLLAHPEPFQDGAIAVGTSMYGDQIVHDKKTVWNAPYAGYEPPSGDYDSIEDAFAAGACVSWFGSLNMSSKASEQANTICLMPGIVLGSMFVADIQANHDWILLHQAAYQPLGAHDPPRPAPLGTGPQP